MTEEKQQLQEKLKALIPELMEKKAEYYRLVKELYRFPVQDYTLKSRTGHSLKLSDLFGTKEELILVHNMGKKCPWCTLWADGFNGIVHHLEERAAFVVSTPDSPEEMRRFARSRRWAFNIVSTQDTTLKKDLGFEDDQGNYHPGVSVIRKMPDGTLLHISKVPFGPGDDFCALWYFFDLLDKPDADWNPQIQY
jgi:predicted dithiol-disulfide oxidoreductase (DUF899 family)